MVVDTFDSGDTGGIEALVQLAVAFSETHHATYLRWPTSEAGRLAPRMLEAYPRLAALSFVDDANLTRGDILIQPELRRCNPHNARRGVLQVIYVLAWHSSGSGLKLRRKFLGSCAVMVHSFWMGTNVTRTRVPRALIVRPYIPGPMVSACNAERETALRENLVLIDDDSNASVISALQHACSDGLNCTTTVVKGYSRAEVLRKTLRAKVVVDFCMIGTERMPVEAVLCGAVLLTWASPLCEGSHSADFPIPRANLVSSEADLAAAVGRVLAHYEEERSLMEPLRRLYAEEVGAASMRQEAAAALLELRRVSSRLSKSSVPVLSSRDDATTTAATTTPAAVNKAARVSCRAPLVFYVGLQKMGTTKFGTLLDEWGYHAFKLPGKAGSLTDYTSSDFEAAKRGGGKLMTMFRDSRNVAVSDFPIFGLPCELAAAYPDAKLVYFRRDFESWYERIRDDILCQWMVGAKNVGKSDVHQWKHGLEFMQFFWREPFAAFWTNKTICHDGCSPMWATIKAGFRKRYLEHYDGMSRCLEAGRLLVLDLVGIDSRLHTLQSFLGCENVSLADVVQGPAARLRAPGTPSPYSRPRGSNARPTAQPKVVCPTNT